MPDLVLPSAATDAGRLEEIDAELTGVEAALRHLDEGTYGICEVCATPIGTEAIEADPIATRCEQHRS
jgi:DnaK suppressor protein